MTAELEALEAIGKNVTEDVRHLRRRLTGLTDLLEREADIIGEWKNNAENVNNKLERLDLSQFQRLPLFRKAFSMALDRLRESAEEYLDETSPHVDTKNLKNSQHNKAPDYSNDK